VTREGQGARVHPENNKAARRRLCADCRRPLRAAVRQCRNNPGGGYGEGRRCRDGELHV